MKHYIAASLLLLIAAVVYPTAVPAEGQGRGAASGDRRAAALRLVDTQAAQQGTLQRMGQCSAMLPPGWSFAGVSPQADAADFVGANGRAFASWGIRGINPAMRAYYGDSYGPPETATLATASMIAHAPAHYTSAALGAGDFFTVRPFAGGAVVGTSMFHAYGAPLAGQYVLSTYFAWTDRGAANLLPTAQAVMVSISCQTQLRPAEPPMVTARTGGRDGKAHGSSDSLKDYNAQTGSQWATSSTGRHYLLDRASQWNDNGPDGPGYYVKSGNSYEKLTPGWGS